jgi:hypothetical protein
MKRFLQRYGEQIQGVLSGFDRLRFRGTLRWLAHTNGLKDYLNCAGVLLKEFKEYVGGVTEQVCAASERIAAAAGQTIRYVNSSKVSKSEEAQKIVEERGLREGLICVFSSVDPCFSYEVRGSSKERKLELRGRQQKCLHYYFYLLHPEFGFMHVRLQTWLPLTIHIGINGREWLSRQLDAAGIGYQRIANCFTQVADLTAAQQLLDQQLRTKWPNVFNQLLREYHPAHRELFRDHPLPYYWSLEQSEVATDVLFRDAATLARLYPHWLRHGAYDLASSDVMRFLGRKTPAPGRPMPKNFRGEVVSDLGRRADHLRVKHRLNQNWIKMYDKQGSVLRVETTLNYVKDLRVFRRAEGQPQSQRKWRIMRRSVVDTKRRAQVSQKANERYLDNLAQVHTEESLGDLTKKLCEPTELGGKRVRALQPWSATDEQLLTAVARPEFTINGFRNRDLRPLLFGPETVTPEEQRRQSAKVSRQLRLLRAHGLILKVNKTHRYQLTTHGRTILSALQAARAANPAQLAQLAA